MGLNRAGDGSADPPRVGFDLDALDAEHPDRPLVVLIGGARVRLRDPRTVKWDELLAALSNLWAFTHTVVPVPARPAVRRLTGFKMARLVRVYRAHFGLGATPADDRRLVAVIGRYGTAIERDLTWRGVDLVGQWQARRWRRLLNLIDGLPRTSAYAEALADDEQLAEQLLDRPPGPGRVPMSEFSPELEMLTNVFDRLGELIQAVTAAAGGKPPKVRPHPRPRTAMDRVRQRRSMAKHRTVVARMLPAGVQPPPAPGAPAGRRAAGDPVPPA
ncbi:MAG TPA: hypothetical protein VF755_29145 [Catenuloplanes sp.]|jgi:hypothetical protein